MLGLYVVPTRFYESSNEQNRMCELCTLSQIRAHIHNDSHCVYEYNGMCIRSYYIFITPGKVTIIVNGMCIYMYIYIFVKHGKTIHNGR